MGIHLHLQLPDLRLSQPFLHLVCLMQFRDHGSDLPLHLVKCGGYLVQLRIRRLLDIRCLQVIVHNFPGSVRQPFDGIQDTGAHLMVQHHAKEAGCHEKHDQDAVCKSQGSAVAGKSSVQVLQVLAHQLVQAPLNLQIHLVQISHQAGIVVPVRPDVGLCHLPPVLSHLPHNPVHHLALPVISHLFIQSPQLAVKQLALVVVLLKHPLVVALAVQLKVGLSPVIDSQQPVYLLVIL